MSSAPRRPEPRDATPIHPHVARTQALCDRIAVHALDSRCHEYRTGQPLPPLPDPAPFPPIHPDDEADSDVGPMRAAALAFVAAACGAAAALGIWWPFPAIWP